MTPEGRADALKRWLDGPAGSEPPPELEPDVVEAVYGLRPDLAPAPRVSADDILAGVSSGPLGVARAPAEGDVVPFPRAAVPPGSAGTSGSGRKARRWLGGTGGIALLLAAAASVLLLLLPKQGPPPPEPSVAPAAAQRDKEVPAPPAAAPEAAAPVASAPSTVAKRDRPSDAGLADEPVPVARSAPSPAAESVGSVDGGAKGAAGPSYAMENQAHLRGRASIPEIQALDSTVSEAKDQDGWRANLDPKTLARVDAALAEARHLSASGDPKAGADRLAKAVGPPAAAGQMLALEAAREYLAAGDPTAAKKVAKRGLDLSEAPSAERAALDALYEDAPATGSQE